MAGAARSSDATARKNGGGGKVSASEIPASRLNAASRSASVAFRRLLLMWKPETRGGAVDLKGPQGPANYFPLVRSVHMIPPHYLADTR